jgi:transcription antitermination factor NusG
MNKWLVILTRPRWEKKVHSALVQKGIECYCPLNKVQRKWSDRIKVVEEPLFKSYVFVKIKDNDRTAVRMTDGVVNFVYGEGKPTILKEKQVQLIRHFLDSYRDIQLDKLDSVEDQVNGELPGKRNGRSMDAKKTAKFQINGSCYILSGRTDKANLMLQQTNL